jgi:Fe-S cluster assembly ATP-binding protein
VFIIQHLAIAIEQKPIITDLSLTITPGSVHAIMGPNGSGKSTLAQTIAGNPQFQITHGSLVFQDTDITHMPPHERAKQGIFLSFQHPPAIPGLTVFALLKEMYQAVVQDALPLELLHALLTSYCERLQLDRSFLERYCHDGFSGGEKKKFELLQIMLLKPKLIILDEIDSGLDIDALKIVGAVLAQVRAENSATALCIITHYQRILNYITPDYVHVLVKGAITASGTAALVVQLEQQGYDGYQTHSP